MVKPPLCACGCGQQVRLVDQTNLSMGRVEGEPNSYIHGHNARKSGPEFSVNPESGCWDWLGALTGRGYGAMTRNKVAHRVYYERFVGPIPKDRELHHICGNKGCVNPTHLEALLRVEHAETKKTTKLSLAKAQEIRLLAAKTNCTHQSLADRFGVARSNISRILRGEAWVLP
jgi:hypothetical protein